MGFFRKVSRAKNLVKCGELDDVVKRHFEGEAVVPEVMSLLEHREWHVRRNAAKALARIGSQDPEAVREAIPKLISLLEDREDHVRGDAAWALGKLRAAEALEKLRGLLSDSAGIDDIYRKGKVTVGEVAREAIERIEER